MNCKDCRHFPGIGEKFYMTPKKCKITLYLVLEKGTACPKFEKRLNKTLDTIIESY